MLLVTGASGFVGRTLLNFVSSSLSPADSHFKLLPVVRSEPLPGAIQVELTDQSAVERLMQSYDVKAVIHLAAEARPGVCENNREAARMGNVETTLNLLNACSATLPHFVYVSTDTVFSGKHAPYHEKAIPDPINTYGRSKADAEKLVSGYPGDWCIVRPALIFGAEIDGKTSFLSWMLNVLKTGEGQFFTDELRSPVWVNDLVRLLCYIVSTRQTEIVHAGGTQCLSRVQFAELVSEVWKIPDPIIRSTSLDADPANHWRPRNVCLDSTRAHSMVEFTDTRHALQIIRDAGKL